MPNKQVSPQQYRLLNRDGTFNVVRPRRFLGNITDLYHLLLSISFLKFMSLIFLGYFLVNLIFATGYLVAGPGALEGTSGTDFLGRFGEAFFFSVQTLATIGYGKISPHGLVANLLVTFEALAGLLGLALATGILFARFSRPTAKVTFSRVALIANHDGVPSLVFRMANRRLNQIVEAQVSVVLARRERTAEGEEYRNFYNLELERSRSPIFAMTWTIVHPITPDSPLYKVTQAQLRESVVEIFVSVTGIDETFSQTIHARFSYIPDEILWDHFFVDMLHQEDGKLHVQLDKLSEIKAAP